MKLPQVIIVMGVAGAGKTTIGKRLAQTLVWSFCDADDFHPPENIAKMSGGVPLNDADRRPWLERLRREVIDPAVSGSPVVLACSALKASYRKSLGIGEPGIAAVYLECDPGTLAERLGSRTGHYMKPGMLASQWQALEVPSPAEALPIAATLSPDEIVKRILAELG